MTQSLLELSKFIKEPEERQDAGEAKIISRLVLLQKTNEIAKIAPSVANSDIMFETALTQAKILHALGLELDQAGQREELIASFERALSLLAQTDEPQNLTHQTPA